MNTDNILEFPADHHLAHVHHQVEQLLSELESFQRAIRHLCLSPARIIISKDDDPEQALAIARDLVPLLIERLFQPKSFVQAHYDLDQTIKQLEYYDKSLILLRILKDKRDAEQHIANTLFEMKKNILKALEHAKNLQGLLAKL